jgi:kynurenine formamidase
MATQAQPSTQRNTTEHPAAPPAIQQETEVPWWPSRYGAADEAGALNEITPAKVLEAVRLVRHGQIHDLAHVLHQDIPAFPGRTFRQYLTTNYHQINRRHPQAGPAGLGRNSVNWVVEQITATQQMGTHVDGLNHLQLGDRTYNGFRLADIVEDHGTSRLGIDTLPQVVTRGLMLDVAAARGTTRLGPGEVITVADAEAALASAGLAVCPGDAVFFHTGWGGLWGTDNERYAAGEPGPGLALAEWLAAHRVALTGCDTWSFGPYPPEDPCEPFIVPQTLNVRYGVVVVENLRLAEAARHRVHEFLLVISHAKLRGATGAWVTPLAIT